MSSTQHGGDAGSDASATEAAQGLHENPHGVTRLIINGFEFDAGKATTFDISRVVTKVEEEEIEWDRIFVPRLRLFHNSHLLLIQGMAPAQLFLASSLMLPDGKEITGPLLYIRGRATDAWVQPCCAYNLVLAKIIRCPMEKMRLEEVSLAIFQDESADYFAGYH